MASKQTGPAGMPEFFKGQPDIRAFTAMVPMMAPQLRGFWAAQDRMLSDVEEFTRGWFSRRHEAARSAAETAGRVTANGRDDPSEAMQAMSDWYTHSFERLSQDARAGVELCSKCMTHMANGGEEEASAAPPAKSSAKGAAAKPASSDAE